MDSPCIKQTVCKVLKIFQCGKYLVAYVLKHMTNIKLLELNDFCGTLIFLLDIYMPNAYREIITLSVYTGLVLVEKKTTIV